MSGALDIYKEGSFYVLPMYKEFIRNISLLLTLEGKGQEIKHEKFSKNYESLCNERWKN